MPVISLDRLPMPNLRVYSCVSVLALSACIYFATQTIKNPSWNGGEDVMAIGMKHADTNITNSTKQDRSLGQFILDVFGVMVREPVCVWTMINMAFCWLILIGTAVQKLVFGELRVSEQQHLKDKFWNFVFYKFIFVFGIINVQYVEEVLLWCSWFSLLGFLNFLSQLSKDRFEYLSFSPTTPLWNHIKLLILLITIFALSGFMLLVSVFVGFFGGFNTFAFMSAEVILLSLRTLHVIIKYGFHLYEMRQESGGNTTTTTTTTTTTIINEENKVWEKRSLILYYIELCFELTILIIDFIHHLHMLVWSNIFLSMASLVICMQIRYLLNEIQRRYKKHRNYLWVRNHLEKNYPMASNNELIENCDNCAICWEKMDSARKLPCEHLFHNTCLLSWLEQDTSCPTCRLSLNIQNPTNSTLLLLDSNDIIQQQQQQQLQQQQQQQPIRRQLNHFFHFDGSRYVSWLPSFSVEVSHAHLMRPNNNSDITSNSQLDAMARQVQQLFPHIPLSIIINDLRITRSVEITIENVLDGRLITPTIFRQPETTTTTTTLTQINQQDETTRNWEDLNVDIVEEDTINLGGRFSKSSTEREKILHKRKEKLIQNARKRYIEKQRAKSQS